MKENGVSSRMNISILMKKDADEVAVVAQGHARTNVITTFVGSIFTSYFTKYSYLHIVVLANEVEAKCGVVFHFPEWNTTLIRYLIRNALRIRLKWGTEVF